MKQLIKGEELKLNDGGASYDDCPNCGKVLRKHISGEGRVFCKYCGKKYEQKVGEGKFIPIEPWKFATRQTCGGNELTAKIEELSNN